LPRSARRSGNAPRSESSPAGSTDLDIQRIIEAFDRHGVEHLIVGGVAANLHGAIRPTGDLDALTRATRQNFDRVAGALLELGAFLRVGRLSDDEARKLPVVIDATMLAQSQISTWRTDAGDLDILHSIPDREGHRVGYDELATRAHEIRTDTGIVLLVAALDDIIASKEWTDRPKDRDALPELRRLEPPGEDLRE
jgi:hypothetical protein